MLQFIQEEQPEFVRYVHYFDKDITVDTVQELIGILSSVPSVDLFFTTVGGEFSSNTVLTSEEGRLSILINETK